MPDPTPHPNDKPCDLARRCDRILRGYGIDDGVTGRLYNLEQQAQRSKQHEQEMKAQEGEIRRLWIWLVITIIAALVALTTTVMQAFG